MDPVLGFIIIGGVFFVCCTVIIAIAIAKALAIAKGIENDIQNIESATHKKGSEQ